MRLRPIFDRPGDVVGGVYAATSKKSTQSHLHPPGPPEDHHPAQGNFCSEVDIQSGAILFQKKGDSIPRATLQYWDKDAKDLSKGDGIDLIRPQACTRKPDGGVWLTAEEYSCHR